MDFADLHFGEFRPFLIFNVGDAAISIAVVILLLRAFLTRKEGSLRRLSNMRKAITAAVLLSAVATAGCATRGRAPDEFAVARNAPLIVPPDFNLAPPVAGTAGLTAGEAQQQAVDALFGGPAPRSAARDEHARRRRPKRRAARHPFEPVESRTRVSSTRGRRPCTLLQAQPPSTNIASAAQ